MAEAITLALSKVLAEKKLLRTAWAGGGEGREDAVGVGIAVRRAPEPDHAVENDWCSGETEIVSFVPEELFGTKLRALLQRRRNRDLFDL